MRVEQGAVDLGIPGLTDAVEVARGGFSTIYRATQSTMERTVEKGAPRRAKPGGLKVSHHTAKPSGKGKSGGGKPGGKSKRR